jgi:hypothetical protein
MWKLSTEHFGNFWGKETMSQTPVVVFIDKFVIKVGK